VIPPWNPCGFAVDLLRSCKRSKFRFFSDSEELTTVEWFFVPAGTPFVPFLNNFVSSSWDSDPKPDGALGEQPYEPIEWLNGEEGPPQRRAHVCGTEQQWRFGQPLPPDPPVARDPQGRLLCCVAGLPPVTQVPPPDMLNIWFVADDLPGPQFASVGYWPNRVDARNPADQVDADFWPYVDDREVVPHRSTHFDGGEYLDLVKPFGGPLWTVWACILPRKGFFTWFREEAEDSGYALGCGFDVALHKRYVRFSPPFGLSARVGGNGLDWHGPVFVKASYDGANCALTCYGDVEGTDSVPFTGFVAAWQEIGERHAGVLSHSVGIPELMGWNRLLTGDEDASILAYLTERYPNEDADVLPGTVIDFAGPFVPTGYLPCDGADYVAADYPGLFATIGHIWDTFRGQSAPSGSNFRVPLLNGLAVIGAGGAESNPTTSARSLADVVGEEEHTLTVPETPAHTHTYSLDDFPTQFGPNYQSESRGAPPSGYWKTTDATGGDGPHNNIQPSVVLLKCIKT
jgi:microcystin-dependent protein